MSDNEYPHGYLRATVTESHYGWDWTIHRYVTGMRVMSPWMQVEWGVTGTRWGAKRKVKAALRRMARERDRRNNPPTPPTPEFIYEEEAQ